MKKFYVPNGLTLQQIGKHLGGSTEGSINQKLVYRDMFLKTRNSTATFTDGFNWQKKREQYLLKKHNGNYYDALEDFVAPSKSQTKFLSALPLDKKIVEEIYREQHGKKSHRRLRKGLSWEKWIANGDEFVPVTKASEQAQLTFGMGGSIKLLATARVPEEFPKQTLTKHANRTGAEFEVPIIGRTNSGKSSLINALLNSYVADYDSSPGTTLSANFYCVGEKFRLVDMPGYGHVSPLRANEAAVRTAQGMMKQYLLMASQGKRNVPRVLVCLHSNLGIHCQDRDFLNLLESNRLKFSVILTKTDEVEVKRLARIADYVRCQLVHYSHCQELMLVSSMRLSGITKLQNVLGNIGSRKRPSVIEDPESVNFARIM
eukprot:PhF_6_TR4328/c0_g1_i1/m.5833/K03978/engB; GTP-binding protein